MRKCHTDEDVAAARHAADKWHQTFSDRRTISEAILDAVAPAIATRAAAGALEAALHLVDDLDAADTLARLADQWRAEVAQ